MKYSLALTSLVSAGVLILACSAEDAVPPPVAAPAQTNPINPAPDTTTPAESMEPEPDMAAPVDGANSEQPAVDAPLVPGTPVDMTPEVMPGEEPVVPPTPPALTLDELVGDMDGHLLSVACGDTPNNDDCLGEGWRSSRNPTQLNGCVGGRLEASLNFPVGGEEGVSYDVRMHFYGVMEPRNYGAVVQREAQGRPNLSAGGTPTPYASMEGGAGNYLSTGDNNYNTYELHVLDNNDEEIAVHFLNADTQTGHYTFGIDFEKTIELIGGGALRLQVADANCRQIKNCGSGGTPCAGKAYVIDISEADPQPAGLQQPGLGKDPEHSGQWFLLDVVDFTTAE